MLNLTKRFDNSSLPIALKWSLMIASFITLAMGLLGWFLHEQQTTFYHQQNQNLGLTLVNQLARSSSEPIMADDDLALNILVHNEEKEPLIIGMQIFDKTAILRASAGVSVIWDIRSLFEDKNNKKQLQWQTPTTTAVSYYSLIRYQKMTVGVAVVTIDRKPLEVQLSHIKNMLITTTIILVLISILLAFPLAYRLFSPIRRLIEVGDALHDDKSSNKITSERKDEIGRVLDSFQFLAEGMESKKKVESAFSQFLSPAIARQVLNQPQGTQLGGSTTSGSVLFCDVVGFTELSENLEPVEVGEILNQYFKYFSIAAHSCNGTVDKFIGDCIMILFGVPEQDDKHGVHAVTCAVLIQKIAEQINHKRQQDNLPIILFRIGINSGDMLAGNLGSDDRMQYTVVGDTVNLTSRICGLCKPGHVLVTEDTLEQPGLRSITSYKSLGLVQVRGRKQSVTPYQINIDHFIRQSDIDDYLQHVSMASEST